mmetsp:Transcript_24483/g.69781  ORF Transcript_24483/g.69781 Transcript_24483/m.69781 type:complete len:207 (+) Transcript_24483:166-786(+)
MRATSHMTPPSWWSSQTSVAPRCAPRWRRAGGAATRRARSPTARRRCAGWSSHTAPLEPASGASAHLGMMPRTGCPTSRSAVSRGRVHRCPRPPRRAPRRATPCHRRSLVAPMPLHRREAPRVAAPRATAARRAKTCASSSGTLSSTSRRRAAATAAVRAPRRRGAERPTAGAEQRGGRMYRCSTEGAETPPPSLSSDFSWRCHIL